MKYTLKKEQVNYIEAGGALQSQSDAFIAKEEQSYQEKLLHVCKAAVTEHKHIILVTGPSASGKTTSAKKIALLLEAQGKKVNRISLDNFYRSKEELPRWEDGYQNYESIEGLDLPCFDHVMHELLTTGTATFPLFDFTAGQRSKESFVLHFDEQTYLIIEGIHALNPLLFKTFQDYPSMKVYISVHSDIVDNGGNVVVSARHLRLTRRLLRDYIYRGTAALGTLKMWNYVLKGEELYIFPFRDQADVHINSVHAYEPFLYHEDLSKALQGIPEDSCYYRTASALLHSNDHFFSLSYDLIPPTSLIQEFIKPKHFDESKITMRTI